MGEHTEKQFVKTEARHRCTPETKGVGAPPNEEEPSKEAVKSLIQGSSSGSWFTFGQLSGFFFHT